MCNNDRLGPVKNNMPVSGTATIAGAAARSFRAGVLEGRLMYGIHLLGEWYDCPAATPEFTQAGPLRTLCIGAARDAGLTVVGDSFYQFAPQGVTGTVLLAESHIAIHTWPEAGFVTVDVYVCNLQTDNTAKAEQVFRTIKTALKPARTRFQAIHRGGKDA
jgi:S-adenosylmethionine decarboxylase proenzyme